MAEDWPTVGSMGGDAEARLARLEALWAQAQQMGLDDLLTGHGLQRFGRGDHRLDNSGYQLLNPGGDGLPAIWMLTAFNADPDTATIFGKLVGDMSAPTATVTLTAQAAAAELASVVVLANSTADAFLFRLATPTFLHFEGDTSDPVTFSEGGMTYRTDLFKLRFVANAVTENIAFESWVTTAIAAPATTWALTGDLTPAQITSNQDNYNPTGLSSASVLRLATDASRDITGIAGGSDGRVLLLFNVGSFNIVLKDDVTSTAANRFMLNGDLTLAPDESAPLWYDSTSSRWRAF